LTGYYAASIPGVRAAAYVIAGFFITLSIVWSVRTWILERRDRKAAGMGS
jgi:membrane-associated protein